jgi:hypothetical protein
MVAAVKDGKADQVRAALEKYSVTDADKKAIFG